jgi:hypothetical protein
MSTNSNENYVRPALSSELLSGFPMYFEQGKVMCFEGQTEWLNILMLYVAVCCAVIITSLISNAAYSNAVDLLDNNAYMF